MRATPETVMARFESLREVLSTLHTEALLAVDVTMSQAQLLHIVAHRPATSMSSLASTLRVGLSAVSGLVDRLVEHGYLARSEDPADRRQHLVTLTPAGREAIDRMHELDVRVFRHIIDALSPSELDAAQVALDAFVREATSMAADADRAHTPPATDADRERTPA